LSSPHRRSRLASRR